MAIKKNKEAISQRSPRKSLIRKKKKGGSQKKISKPQKGFYSRHKKGLKRLGIAAGITAAVAVPVVATIAGLGMVGHKRGWFKKKKSSNKKKDDPKDTRKSSNNKKDDPNKYVTLLLTFMINNEKIDTIKHVINVTNMTVNMLYDEIKTIINNNKLYIDDIICNNDQNIDQFFEDIKKDYKDINNISIYDDITYDKYFKDKVINIVYNCKIKTFKVNMHMYMKNNRTTMDIQFEGSKALKEVIDILNIKINEFEEKNKVKLKDNINNIISKHINKYYSNIQIVLDNNINDYFKAFYKSGIQFFFK